MLKLGTGHFWRSTRQACWYPHLKSSRHYICPGAGYTAVDPESRRIIPSDVEKSGRTIIKMVYVVLEAQYQVGKQQECSPPAPA